MIKTPMKVVKIFNWALVAGIVSVIFAFAGNGFCSPVAVNPADKQAQPSISRTPDVFLSLEEHPGPDVKEDDKVGTYAQPQWTTQRRFPRVRVYVIPEGQLEFEYWTRVDVPSSGPSKVQNMYELEMGLPYRFQLDLYLVTRKEGTESPTFMDQQFELRYALADWGKIWGNPTLYAEYVSREAEADKIETKILFGDQLCPRWHWGANLVYEGEIGGELAHEYSMTAGLSYSVIDRKFSVGAEAEAAMEDVAGDRGNFAKSVLAGPSFQFHPRANMHVDLAPLFALTGEPAAKLFLNIGWEF